MRGIIRFFNGLVRTPLVRSGNDEKLIKNAHCFLPVYIEMLLQITRDYPGLPDVRTLQAHEIKFFYEGLRQELKIHSKPRG